LLWIPGGFCFSLLPSTFQLKSDEYFGAVTLTVDYVAPLAAGR